MEQNLIDAMKSLTEAINVLNKNIHDTLYEPTVELSGHLEDLKMSVEKLNKTMEETNG